MWITKTQWAWLTANIVAIRSDILALKQQTETANMATKATLDALVASTMANTSATQSAAIALAGFVKTNTDLTQQLADAIKAGQVDDPDILAAVDAITANNATLTAAIPAVSAAVVRNTPSPS